MTECFDCFLHGLVDSAEGVPSTDQQRGGNVRKHS